MNVDAIRSIGPSSRTGADGAPTIRPERSTILALSSALPLPASSVAASASRWHCPSTKTARIRVEQVASTPSHLMRHGGGDVGGGTWGRVFAGGHDRHLRATDDLIIMPLQCGTQ